MKVKFLRSHNLRVKPALVLAIPEGIEKDLPRAIAEELIANEIAVEVPKPAKKEK